MAKKEITLTVTLSVPDWLTKSGAKKELRARVNECCAHGVRHPSEMFVSIEESDVKVKRIV